MNSSTANPRDPARFSVLVEFEDTSAYSPESSRCASPLSSCSWDSRTNNDNRDHIPLQPRVDGNVEDILNGIKNLDIGTSYHALRNSNSTSHLSAGSSVSPSHRLDHRKYIVSSSSRTSSGSSLPGTVNSFEVPRPASPSLLLGLDNHLRPLSFRNKGDFPKPSSDIDGEVERHTAGQFQAVLAVPVCDNNRHLNRIANPDAVVFKHTNSDKLFTLVYGISLLEELNKTKVPGSGHLSAADCRPGVDTGAKTDSQVNSGSGEGDQSFTNIASIIATRLDTNHEILKKHPSIFQRIKDAPSNYPYAQVYPVPIEHEDQPPSYAEAVPSSILNNKMFDQVQPMARSLNQTPTRSPSHYMSPALRSPFVANPPSAPSRIEDSVEALDRLADDIEALDAQFNPVMTPTRENTGDKAVSSSHLTPKRSPITPRQQAQTLGRSKAVEFQLNNSMRRSSSLSLRKSTENSPLVESGDRASKTRSFVARPNSLLPPKPLAKSAKPITSSTFELPGVAVSRRLKEQKEARLAAKLDQEAQSPAHKTPPRVSTPSLHRVKSTKRLTIPNFELPGEAISRRKRLEHEERLRRQEEEERKAREFKARPIPASIFGGGQYPRETLSSRARQGKASEGDKDCRSTPKRASILTAQGRSTPRSSTPGSDALRGRNLEHKLSGGQLSRATSTSTIGQSSTVSAEDINMQRQRAKQVVAQDSQYTRNKELDRKKREQAAKAAREEAAERSRQASREWAEKQRRKQAAERTPKAVGV
ncbi:hypothetical protein BROUX41_005158 [Berkeleyomyces rouxiae]|uniref:uncharacterized protein n=1 Tax=Berkeleyomyces rouxiae TaxID=2035830 RepID=UPI003B7BFD35